MRKRLSTLDYGELLGQGVPAMVTVTLPCADVDCGRCRPGGDRHAPCTGWAAFAANGQAFKALIRKFVKRFERAWSRRLRALWKLEFQSRGAPHMHLLMVPPQGEVDGLRWRDWFARAWADCLDVQGETRAAVIAVHSHRKASADYAEGMRASDPKRIAVYFAKHGVLADKEYQHIVPGEWQGEGDGPGRFWGYWGLARADVAVPVTDAEALAISRTLRRWQASKGVRYTRPVVRLDTRTGTIRARNVVRRYRGMPDSAGFLIVNDGPGVALMLAELLRRRT